MSTQVNTEVATSDLIECEICMSEIPHTVAGNAEADEYVSHYCGLECYQQWLAKKQEE